MPVSADDKENDATTHGISASAGSEENGHNTTAPIDGHEGKHDPSIEGGSTNPGNSGGEGDLTSPGGKSGPSTDVDSANAESNESGNSNLSSVNAENQWGEGSTTIPGSKTDPSTDGDSANAESKVNQTKPRGSEDNPIAWADEENPDNTEDDDQKSGSQTVCALTLGGVTISLLSEITMSLF